MVVFEHDHLSREQRSAALSFLEGFGLTETVEEFGDTMALRRSLLSQWCTAAVGLHPDEAD